jgi:hypothetical protein
VGVARGGGIGAHLLLACHPLPRFRLLPASPEELPMTEYDHHRHMALLLRQRHLAASDGGGRQPATTGVLEVDRARTEAAAPVPARLATGPSAAPAQDIPAGGRALTQGYFETYTSSDGIHAEHALDARALLCTMQALPAFWSYLRDRAHTDHLLTSLGIGCGEAAKDLALIAGLVDAFATDGLGRFLLLANEPDDKQLIELAKRVAALPTGLHASVEVRVLQRTCESLLEAVAAGRPTLNPPPDFATCMHMAYYLKQHNQTIPILSELTRLTAGPTFFVVEGEGHLQEMKRRLRDQRGLGDPASAAMVQATLDQHGIPHAWPPILIPNRGWKVDKTLPPGEMFCRDWLFLLDGNYGNSRPLEWEDYVVAGSCFQELAQPDGAGGWCLDGPDALIVGGEWLADHPQDMTVLEQMGRASAAERAALGPAWGLPPPGTSTG